MGEMKPAMPETFVFTFEMNRELFRQIKRELYVRHLAEDVTSARSAVSDGFLMAIVVSAENGCFHIKFKRLEAKHSRVRTKTKTKTKGRET